MAHLKIGNTPEGQQIKSIITDLRRLREKVDTWNSILQTFDQVVEASELCELLGIEAVGGVYPLADLVALKNMVGSLRSALNGIAITSEADILTLQREIL